MRTARLAAAVAAVLLLSSCDLGTTGCPAGSKTVDHGFFQTIAVGNSVQMFWLPIIECEVSK